MAISTYVYNTCYKVSAIKGISMLSNLLVALSKRGTAIAVSVATALHKQCSSTPLRLCFCSVP